MKNRVYIIHGWGGTPHEHWLPWLTHMLEEAGCEVHVPAMLHTDEPVIAEWVEQLDRVVGELDEHTYFVGHSIGCQAILRYLQTQTGKKAGGCVLVAAWFLLENLESIEEERFAKPWMRNDMDYEAIRNVTRNIMVLNSENDPFGAVEENSRLLKERLHAHVTILKNKGHFTEEDGIRELPEALEILKAWVFS